MPASRITASASADVPVCSWIKVSPFEWTKLISPGVPENAALPMKVKAWLPEVVQVGVDGEEADAIALGEVEVGDHVGGVRLHAGVLGDLPDEAVAAATADQGVGGGIADEDVIARIAMQDVVAAIAPHRVVSVAAVERVGGAEAGERVVAPHATEHIAAAVAKKAVAVGRAGEVLDADERVAFGGAVVAAPCR